MDKLATKRQRFGKLKGWHRARCFGCGAEHKPESLVLTLSGSAHAYCTKECFERYQTVKATAVPMPMW